jgi:hypothetical protein
MQSKQFVSEGARVTKNFSVLQHPNSNSHCKQDFVNKFDLPANLNMQKKKKGPQ